MKSKLLAILQDANKEVIAMKHTLTQADYYDPTTVEKNKVISLLSSNDVLVVESKESRFVRYSISTPKDKAKLYDRYGNIVDIVQRVIYTIDVFN